MKQILGILVLSCATLILSGCSVFGNSGVEIAPYTVLEKEDAFEVRHYDNLVLVTTPMLDMENTSNPFSKLFNYISGKNSGAEKIAMTAPVFMDQGDNKSETMSFVLPKDFSIKKAPRPNDPTVQLEEIKDYTVATITFNGVLQQDNIQKNKVLLNEWITKKNYTVTGPAKAAGYNPPFTLPAFRRNEVLIPIEEQM